MAEEKTKTPTSPDEVKEHLRKIRKGIRITKITCTRSVKGRNGDSFVAFSAAWQSVQDDHGGPGADVMATPDEDRVYAEQGLSIKDAKLARHMLAMECDLAALESALANGSISSDYYKDAVRGIRNNYDTLVLRDMGMLPNDNQQGS
jgi:hypothetical protein